jgi:hypothetical protein
VSLDVAILMMAVTREVPAAPVVYAKHLQVLIVLPLPTVTKDICAIQEMYASLYLVRPAVEMWIVPKITSAPTGQSVRL